MTHSQVISRTLYPGRTMVLRGGNRALRQDALRAHLPGWLVSPLRWAALPLSSASCSTWPTTSRWAVSKRKWFIAVKLTEAMSQQPQSSSNETHMSFAAPAASKHAVGFPWFSHVWNCALCIFCKGAMSWLCLACRRTHALCLRKFVGLNFLSFFGWSSWFAADRWIRSPSRPLIEDHD